jgi:hypothetical protein
VQFTELAHQTRHREANGLLVPESPAARYLAHQANQLKAERIAGVK